MPAVAFQQNDEIIAGYRLLDRLGSGGYGEVWKATAPGGLLKAVKIVYGRVEEMRGERELKALERIKELRHPFVISLERVEIVNGQLVFVTELAERSLKDLFDQCRGEGKPGIPRKELLGYLHDSADALDYMREKLQLQHLDVKPENLLLAGNHAKVADFGLVKRLEDVSVSLMGGLTPLYASPESFDGTPSLFSDQYSLAIVYQEMLTGILPFSGATISKLAAQHLTGAPNLSPLLEHDRAVLRRALAKDPAKRFASCRDMVEALQEQRSEASKVRRERLDAILDRPGDGDSDAKRGSRPTGHETARGGETSLGQSAAFGGFGDPPHPTLWIGLGGLGVQTLRRLKRQAEGAAAQADFFLAMDSDGSSASSCGLLDGESSLGPGEFLALPLRRSQDYQELPSETLRNVNRRWIYNLPRSQRVEGLRPLGQLIFLGERKIIRQTLSDKIELLRAAAERYREAGARGKLVIVAGINGGTGSGMIVETLKEIAGLRFALKEIDVAAVLLSTGGRTATQRELGAANAVATLVEMESFVAGQPTGGKLDGEIFVLQSQADASEADIRDWLSDVAEGLQIQRRFGSADGLAESRAATRSERTGGRLRSFSVVSLDRVTGNRLREWTSMLCRLAAEDWLGGSLRRASNSSPTNASIPLGSLSRRSEPIDEKRFDEVSLEIERKLGLTPEGAGARIDGVFRNAAGRSIAAAAEEIAGAFLPKLVEGDGLSEIAKLAWESRDLGWAELPLGKGVEKSCESWIGGARTKFVEWLRSVADKPGVGVVGSLRLLTRFAEHLDLLRKEAQSRFAEADRVATLAVSELDALRRQAGKAPSGGAWKAGAKPDDAVKELAGHGLAALWDRETARAAEQAIGRAVLDLRKRREHLQHLQRELGIVAESFSGEYESLRTDLNADAQAIAAIDDLVHRRILARVPDFLRAVNALVLPKEGERATLGPWMEPGKSLSADLCDSLRAAAAKTIEEGVAEFRRNPGECLEEWRPALEGRVADLIRGATPTCYRDGASVTYLLRSGSGDLQRILEPALSAALAARPVAIADVDRESVLYGEIDGLEFSQVRDLLTKDRPDLVEISERLQLWRDAT